MLIYRLLHKWLTTFGSYLILMGRSITRPDRFRMFLKRYVKEMSQLGVDSIGIVLLSCYLYPDEGQHPITMDAPLGDRLHHT